MSLPLLLKQRCQPQAINANFLCPVLCWSERCERGWRQQCRKKSPKRRHRTPLLVCLLWGCMCVRVSWLGSHRQPQRKGPAVRLLALCLYHYMFNGTKQESSCCPPPSPANKQRGSHASFTGRVSGNLHSCSV